MARIQRKSKSKATLRPGGRSATFFNSSTYLDNKLSSSYLLSSQQKTLVYAPEVRMYIAMADGKMLDVSQDIVNLSMNRVVNSVSNFSAQIANFQNKYKGRIGRMDRVVVFMKRTKWQQVFAGYITSVPILQIYPGPMTITGECTLKRLIHTYWDPGLKASVELFNDGIESALDQAAGQPDLDEDEIIANALYPGLGSIIDLARQGNRASDSIDGGATKIMTTLLTEVANWDKDQIHIQAFPKKLSELMSEWSENEDYSEAAEEYLRYVFGSGQAAGVPGGTLTDIEAFMYAMRMVESNNNYKINSPISSASGAYQYITSTWAGYGGYSRAYLAPPHVQDARARKDFTDQFNKLGDWEKVAAYHLYPAWANDKSKWNQAPGRGNPTVRQYVDKVMGHFRQRSSGDSGGDPSTGGVGSPNTDGQNVPDPTPGADPVPTPDGGTEGQPATIGGEVVKSPVDNHRVTSPFGYRTHPISGGRKLHAGVDLVGSSTIKAALSGTVKSAGTMSGYGNTVDLEHGNGLVTRYAHLASMAVSTGQSVSQGTKLGVMGATGNVTGVHLHWEWRVNDKPEDPMTKLGNSVSVSGGGGSSGEGGIQNPVEQLFNFFGTYKTVNQYSYLLEGEKMRLNDEPLMPSIQTVAKGSMRSFMSGPNGDFIAFYPDYFGLYGTKATFTLDQVEMKNVFIQASDQNITTHVFVAGSRYENQPFQYYDWLDAQGVVTIDQDFVRDELLNLTDDKGAKITAKTFMEKFGARPINAQYPQIRTPEMEYFLAIELFLKKWSSQYSTRVELTFMPELFPGMRIILAGLDIAVYVEAVSHNCDYTNGFTTSVTISSPSAINGNESIGLAKGGA